MPRIAIALFALLLTAAGGCSDEMRESSPAADSAAAPEGLVGQANGQGSFLAYSHDATVRLAGPDIAARVSAVRTACMDGRHGQCTVLGEQQGSGQWPTGQLLLRAEPKAIEPLVAMAAQGGELSQRGTQAEDLIALSNQLAQIETELQASEQEAAQQQRRIRTNLLTLSFESSQVTVASSRLGEALRDSLSVLDASVAVVVTVIVAVLPFALLAGALFWVIKALLRRRRRRVGRAGE